MNRLAGMMTSNRGDWETPPELMAYINEQYGPFDLDPASNGRNAKAPAFYTPEEDGLSMPWFGRVFLNPPYGRAITEWIAAAARQAQLPGVKRVVALIPARTDTIWWHTYVQGIAHVEFLKGRVKFLVDGERRGTAPFPSALAIYDHRRTPGP